MKVTVCVFALIPFAVADAVFAAPARLTVYQHDLALVQETRELKPDATGWVVLGEVSEAAIVDSLNVQPDHGYVKQQSFRYDPPTLVALLARHVGKRITVIHTNPGSGAEQSSTPLLVSVESGRALIADQDRIESLPIGDSQWRYRFAAMPEGMTAEPQLRAQLSDVQTQEAGLSYLTGGVGWQAHYRLLLGDARGNQQPGDLEARVEVYNNTTMSWHDATLELVAGDLNRAASAPVPRIHAEMMMRSVSADMAGAAPEPQRDSVGDYHLYRVPGPVALPANERRDLHLLHRDGVAVQRDYRFDFGNNRGLYQPIGADEPIPAAIRLRLDNQTPDPLPGGLWRAYARGADGVLRLLGEDRSDNVPIGKEVRLDIGHAFDVTARRVQTRFRRLNNRETESDWRVEIANAGDQGVTVELIDQLGLNWEITEQSDAHETPDAQHARWTLSVPAHGERVLSYQVTTRQR
ncbi:MAG: DUF4139 domain-containing protein [Gammaproteobacteria bacterium]|nr:DUF4139 domain-containing protein [Gammaproteobacteria bacterium]MCP5137444.1 DUF4139 domain-containing protein [Gammaproteobacteria bacterium]